MAFDEYQFLRYFIPGSLYSIYTMALIVSVLSPDVLVYFSVHPEALLGIVSGIIGSSLAIGYLLYSFFDKCCYQRLVWDTKKRLSKEYLGKLIFDWDEIEKSKPEQAKMFLDMLWITFKDSDSSEKYSTTLRGTWSHLCARLCCCFVVPFFSFVSFGFVLFANWFTEYLQTDLKFHLFSLAPQNLIFIIFGAIIIILISVFLGLGANRPFKEGTTLELFFIKHIIDKEPSEFKRLVKTILDKDVTDLVQKKIKEHAEKAELQKTQTN
jgi:hypothetical protein